MLREYGDLKEEIKKYYHKQPKLRVFIQEITHLKNGAYAIKFDQYKSIGTHWIAFYINII